MNISYVTTYDAHDIHQWSGLGLYIAKALEQEGGDLDYIGNLDTPITKYMEFKYKVYAKLGKRYLMERIPSRVKASAKMAEQQIKANADIIFSPSTLPIGLIRTKKSKVFYTDATFAGMINFYEYFTNVAAESLRAGNAIEQAALDSSAMAIYSSDWAAKTAIDNYRIDPSKVKVVPFGANIVSNRSTADIQDIVNAKDKKHCHLLFIGVEWLRKGGDIAVAVAKKLNEIGLPTTLHVAGMKEIPGTELPSFVKNYGYISKGTPEGEKLLNDLFAQSHFLILPTRADCTPVVYAEANSFGLPCISSNVGGIDTIIHGDINGKTFAANASIDSYVNYIEAKFGDADNYADLCLSSFNEYQTRLNWGVTGKKLMELLKEL